MELRAVIFDVGGVIQESPLEFLREYEARHDLPEGFIASLVGNYAARPDGAWQRLERGELLLDEFCRIFDSEIASLGYSVSTAAMMLEMADYVVIRPRMIEAVRRLRTHGLKTAALTNNWLMEEKDEEREALRSCFDAFVESCRTGLRKPDPRIYELTCEALGVLPAEAAFLDDIGANLKTAARLGMLAIKVADPDAALRELGEAVGIELVDPAPAPPSAGLGPGREGRERAGAREEADAREADAGRKPGAGVRAGGAGRETGAGGEPGAGRGEAGA